jgi:hypothetical protein
MQDTLGPIEGYEKELRNVDKLKQKYHHEIPIWWYTSECFVYPILNHRLQTMDVNIIIKMGFFISNLHRHIQNLHFQQFNGHQTVHRLSWARFIKDRF